MEKRVLSRSRSPEQTIALGRALANALIRGGDFERGTRYLQDAAAARDNVERARAALETALAD